MISRVLPSAVTLLGLVLGLAGVVLGATHGWPLLVASLVLDALDGHFARALLAETDLGAAFDWDVDVTLSHVLAWRSLPIIAAAVASLVLVGWQVLAPHYGIRSSGRLFSWAAIVAWVLLVGAQA